MTVEDILKEFHGEEGKGALRSPVAGFVSGTVSGGYPAGDGTEYPVSYT